MMVLMAERACRASSAIKLTIKAHLPQLPFVHAILPSCKMIV